MIALNYTEIIWKCLMTACSLFASLNCPSGVNSSIVDPSDDGRLRDSLWRRGGPLGRRLMSKRRDNRIKNGFDSSSKKAVRVIIFSSGEPMAIITSIE